MSEVPASSAREASIHGPFRIKQSQSLAAHAAGKGSQQATAGAGLGG
jgi:hypothetical protein